MKIIDAKCWNTARRFPTQPEKRSFTVGGSTTGPGIFELFLGEGASPSSYEFLQSIDPDVDYGDGTWSIPLNLEAGQYTLEARGTHLHPDSNHQATDSSTFTVSAPDPTSITTTYDSYGRVETRSWATGDVVQTFNWDAQGHLLSITQIDTGTTETVGSYIWTAQYDGFGRRFQTDYAPDGANAITIEKNRIKTWFDPQVEFMVAAVEHHDKREWLVHGPDLDTGYGSFQGLGGLEAIVDEATGKTTPIVDTVHGHVVATIDLGDTSIIADDLVIYKEQQFGGYGPLPSSEQQPLEVTESLAESLGWQTRCVDPTSFFAMGARHYDPLSGRFLSADPLGHGATPDLYSYAGGYPINFIDPTGRDALGPLSNDKVIQEIRAANVDPNQPKAFVTVGDNDHSNFILTGMSYAINSANALYAGIQLDIKGYDVTIDYSGSSEALESNLGDPNTSAFVYYGHGGFDAGGVNPVIETRDGKLYTPVELGEVTAAEKYDHAAIHACYSCVPGSTGTGFKEELNATQFHGYDRTVEVEQITSSTLGGKHLIRDPETSPPDFSESAAKPSKDKVIETKSDKADPVSGKNPRKC